MTARTPDDYYHFQATARGVHSLADVQRAAESKAHIYDRVVAPWLPADRQAVIAELACGHGSFLHWLKTRGFQAATGVDSSAEQIAFARQTGVPVVEADLLAWLRAEPAQSHGAIVAIDVVEHIPRETFLDMLAESRRVLAPGGSLILRLPNGDSPLVGLNLFNDITHVWTYTSNCVNSVALMLGFATTEYVDESEVAIRDGRWFKVPLHRLCKGVLNLLVRSASYERVRGWSPHLWIRLTTATSSLP